MPKKRRKFGSLNIGLLAFWFRASIFEVAMVTTLGDTFSTKGANVEMRPATCGTGAASTLISGSFVSGLGASAAPTNGASAASTAMEVARIGR